VIARKLEDFSEILEAPPSDEDEKEEEQGCSRVKPVSVEALI